MFVEQVGSRQCGGCGVWVGQWNDCIIGGVDGSDDVGFWIGYVGCVGVGNQCYCFVGLQVFDNVGGGFVFVVLMGW